MVWSQGMFRVRGNWRHGMEMSLSFEEGERWRYGITNVGHSFGRR